jgi:hypothetical protein
LAAAAPSWAVVQAMGLATAARSHANASVRRRGRGWTDAKGQEADW